MLIRRKLNRFLVVLGWSSWLVMSAFLTAASISGQEANEDKVTFDDHIQPLLRQRCSSCHSPDRRNGDLDVTTYITLMQGGGSGAVIEPGDLDFSYMYSLVTHQEEPVMPPGNQKIPDAEIALIARWIEGGALENMGSTAVIKKKKVGMAAVENPMAKPSVVPLPARTILEPLIQPTAPPNADSIAISPWAPIVALGGQKQVLLYHLQTQQLVGVIPYHDGQVNSLRFSRNGQWLAIGGGKAGLSGNVLIWNVVKGEPVTTVGNELDAVLACDISPDHSMVALGGPQRVVRVYATDSGELLFEMSKHTEWVTAIEFSPDGALLATGDRNGGVETWEAMTGRSYMTLTGHTKAITAISWRSDSNIVASGSEDTTIRLWELNGGSQVRSWNAHGVGTLGVEFAMDGRLVSCGRDNVTKLWDQQGTALKSFPALPDIPTDVSICNETNHVVAGAFGGKVAMWETENATWIADLTTAPKSLEQQVSDAERVLSERQAALEQSNQQHQAAKVAHDQIEASLAELNNQRQTTAKNLEQLQIKLAAANAQAADAEVARMSATEPMIQTQDAIPMVEDSLAKLREAASKLPEDASLHQNVVGLNTELESMKAKMNELKTKSDEAASKVSEANKIASESNAEITTAQAGLAEFDQKIAVLNEQLEPAKQSLQAASAQLESVTTSHQQAVQLVEFWRNEVAFKQQLIDLVAKLNESETLATSKQQGVAAAQQQLTEAQSRFDQARTELSNTEADITSYQNQIESLKIPVGLPQADEPVVEPEVEPSVESGGAEAGTE